MILPTAKEAALRAEAARNNPAAIPTVLSDELFEIIAAKIRISISLGENSCESCIHASLETIERLVTMLSIPPLRYTVTYEVEAANRYLVKVQWPRDTDSAIASRIS